MHRTTIHYEKYSRSCRIYYGYSEVQVGSSSSRMSGDILNRIICYEERARFTVPRYNTNGNNNFYDIIMSQLEYYFLHLCLNAESSVRKHTVWFVL